MTRQEARDAGLTKYFTGRPCKHGHIAERRMSDGCIECADKAARAWQAAHPEKVKAKTRAYQQKNADKLSAKNRAWRKANPDKHAALTAAWRAANEDRVKATKSSWKKSNVAKVNAENMRRYASKMNATPAWADNETIEQFYECAQVFRRIGLNMHVDHIVPLQGKAVCGLHVHNNLQILTAFANQSKSNRF